MSGVTSSSLCWLLLCVNLLVSADQIHIQAEPGQTVILPCRAPDSNSPVTAVEWSRPDLEPEHVLLYNEDYSYPENQHPSFKNRVDLQDRRMKDGDASLILKDVRTEDSGTYECSVIQRGDQKTWKRDAFNTEPIRTINLSVGSDQRNISATPGHQRVLTCRDPQTGNIVAVEWKRKDLSGYVLRYRDEHYDDENQNPSYQNRVHLQDRLMRNRDVSLVLEKVNFSDRGTYECHSQVAGSIERKQICSITLNVSARGGSDGQQRNGYTAAMVLLGSLLVSTGHF
ncbi:programmed cell death 1 ligand 1-like isoform X2 [Cyprinodon tularosa]|uniref:programmed cell death 1 ligand 1-like isoform X2 n=1 Tax=Cyprinodon tularosa TaxID=77115 RepID=UPI0018E26FDB|nr:programmed cell death 1 ligand 1-like isoform X2 [Cyprinodon tularosa]